jgi:multidrug efflux pump subunit AcrA (membrane-fusion protein)
MRLLELFVASFKGKKLKVAETLLVAFLVALLFFSLIFAFSSGPQDPPKSTTSAPVAIKVGYGDITSSVTQAGKVVSLGTAYVSPKTQSRVTGLFVNVGTTVKKDTLLATLENNAELQSLAQAKVALNVAVVQLNNLTSNIQALQESAAANALSYQNAVTAALNSLNAIKAQAQAKDVNYQNAVNQAGNSRAAAQYDYDQAIGTATVTARWFDLERAKIAFNTAVQNQTINKQNDDIEISNLNVDYQNATYQKTTGQQKDTQAIAAAQRSYATLASQFGVSVPNPTPEDFALPQLAIAAAQRALDATYIRSPISGVITNVGAEIGQNAPNGGYNSSGKIESFFTITSDGMYQLQCDFDLLDGPQLRTGSVATLTFMKLKNPVREAKIVSIRKMPPNQDTPPSYKISFEITGQKDDIYPGLDGTAEVAIRGLTNVLIIPNMAVITKTGTTYVRKYDDKGKNPVLTRVYLGLVGKSTSQVLAGLTFGDLIELPKEESTTEASG